KPSSHATSRSGSAVVAGAATVERRTRVRFQIRLFVKVIVFDFYFLRLFDLELVSHVIDESEFFLPVKPEFADTATESQRRVMDGDHRRCPFPSRSRLVRVHPLPSFRRTAAITTTRLAGYGRNRVSDQVPKVCNRC